MPGVANADIKEPLKIDFEHNAIKLKSELWIWAGLWA